MTSKNNTISVNIISSKQIKTTSYDSSLQPLCKAHLHALVPQLRQEDKQELWAFYRLPELEGLKVCFRRSSLAFALFIEGKLCAIAGVAPDSLLGRQACVWQWTSVAVNQYPRTFYQISRRVLAYFKSFYPCLYAVCDERYTAARRYLLHLGAKRQAEPFYLAGRETRFELYIF